MASRAVIFLQSTGYESAFQAASLGMTAVASGDEVCFVIGFDALRALVRGTFGRPASEKENAESLRAEGLGVPAPLKMLEDARRLGARLIACDAVVKVCGLSPKDVEGRIDETLGLAAIWQLAANARTLSF